eukprot:symbB.v1.2.015243.t1/scaffold1132.1/size136097/14
MMVMGVDLLTRAVWGGQAEMVKMLLDAGATSTAAAQAAESAPFEIGKLFGYTQIFRSRWPFWTGNTSFEISMTWPVRPLAISDLARS